MGYRIQILGPAMIWDVDDDGVWHPLPVPEGDGASGLLATLIFNRDIADWDSVAAHLWDRADVAEDRKKYKVRVSRLASFVRESLGRDRDIIKRGATPGISGRQPGRREASVRIDWDDLTQYQREGRHRE